MIFDGGIVSKIYESELTFGEQKNGILSNPSVTLGKRDSSPYTGEP